MFKSKEKHIRKIPFINNSFPLIESHDTHIANTVKNKENMLHIFQQDTSADLAD